MSATHDLDYTGEANGPAWAAKVDDTVNANTARDLGRLTNVAGTNAISGRLAMSTGFAGISDGARVRFVAAATNTGAVTLQLKDTAGTNVGSAFALRDADGVALAAGAIVSGRLYEFAYSFSEGYARQTWVQSASATVVYDAYTANGTWSKPTNVTADSRVLVQAWGAGGGGSTNGTGGGGGGGGGYVEQWFLASDLSSSESVTVGAGGAAATAGGNSSLGTKLTAYGGGGGQSAGQAGGGGGGVTAAGANGSGGVGGAGGSLTFGTGGAGGSGGGSTVAGGSAYLGGGGGGGNGAVGGSAVYGGGGGGGMSSTGGASRFGGAGGNAGAAGTAPGGGGGGAVVTAGTGARGEVRVTVFI